MYNVTWVDSLAAASRQLRDHGTSIVVTELGLADSQGLSTVQALASQEEHVPLVVFTSTANEHLAAAAIEAGAQEFLIKGDVDCKAFLRHLSCALKRKSLEAAKTNKLLLLENIFQSLPEAVVAADAGGNILLWNRQAERLVGKRIVRTHQDDWIETYGIYLPNGITPYPLSDLPMSRALRGERVEGAELVLSHSDFPQPRRFVDNAAPVEDRSGNIIGGVVSMRQVVEPKTEPVCVH